MNDATRRATRTFVQALPGGFLVTGWNLFTPPTMHLNAEQAAWMIVFITAVSSYVMNLLETATGHAFLKTATEQMNAKQGA